MLASAGGVFPELVPDQNPNYAHVSAVCSTLLGGLLYLKPWLLMFQYVWVGRSSKRGGHLVYVASFRRLLCPTPCLQGEFESGVSKKCALLCIPKTQP